MTEQEFATFLSLGREQRAVEFKGPGARTDKRLFAQVVRAVLAMANLRDGGKVILGVQDTGTSLHPVGLSVSEVKTWKYDDVADSLALYADPFVTFDVQTVSYQGSDFVVIVVDEFEEVPLLCKKDFAGVLRDGACYVRSRRKPESIEVPSYVETRELLDVATEKSVRRFVRRARATGMFAVPLTAPSVDEKMYDNQLGELR